MRIILIILAVIVFLYLFGEFLLDLILGAFALIVGTIVACVRTLFARITGRGDGPDPDNNSSEQ